MFRIDPTIGFKGNLRWNFMYAVDEQNIENKKLVSRMSTSLREKRIVLVVTGAQKKLIRDH